jgi:hypothetical protein
MRTLLVALALLALMTATFGSCKANPLDDCTLQNMVGVTSDAAAKFVRQACLGKISAGIPPNELWVEATAAIAKGQFSNDSQLYLDLQNKSQYAITELMIRITTNNGTTRNDYRVTRFVPIYTGPGIVTGLPPDPADYLQIKPFSTVRFSFQIREAIPNKNEKWRWDILSAKGYLATNASPPVEDEDLVREWLPKPAPKQK